MKFEKIYNKGQAQIFKNEYLEIITKTNPVVIWILYLPVVSFLLYKSYIFFNFSITYIILFFVLGIVFWTFFEYIMHRFVFHFVSESVKAQRWIYIIHGNHHQYPRDKERLFMPPVPSLIIASILFGIQYFILNNHVYMFFAGFVIGYLMYGTMHYAIHAYNPPFKWMKPLWRNHHLHHYKIQEKGFGVSTTIWDRLFGTMFDLKKEKEDKEKVNSLMYK